MNDFKRYFPLFIPFAIFIGFCLYMCLYMSINQPVKKVRICKKENAMDFIRYYQPGICKGRNLIDAIALDNSENGYVKLIYEEK
jgi:hypothetical protein